jgi:hypothetical protein
MSATTVSRLADPKMEDDRLSDLPLVGSDKRWVVAKIVLRSIVLLVAIAIAVMCAIVAVAVYPLTVIVSYPYIIPTIIWNCSEFLVMCLQRSSTKGITPKAHVGVELIMWMGGVVVLAFQSSFIPMYYPESRALPAPYNYQSNWRYALEITTACLTGLLVVLQFVLFVRACVEVDRRKKDRRIQKLVMALQRRGRDPSELPLSTYALARQTSFPKDMLDTRDLPLPVSPVKTPVSPVKAPMTEPDSTQNANAKYDADAIQRARELDIRESQKVLIDPRVEGAIRR